MTEETKKPELQRIKNPKSHAEKWYKKGRLDANIDRDAYWRERVKKCVGIMEKTYKQFWGVQNCDECGRGTDEEVLKELDAAIRELTGEHHDA